MRSPSSNAGTSRGLLNKAITIIVQRQGGYLWIATWDGMA